MLAVQKFLIDNYRGDAPGQNFQMLTEMYGIKCIYHPTDPLVILSYDQIESPKMEKIVRECRGLVLDTTDYSIACGCMERFFNIGEAEEITGQFKWDKAIYARTKEDGSLLSLFWNKYSQKWQVKTRNSWADQPIGENLPRWDELFFSLINRELLSPPGEGHSHTASFDTGLTYVFELCSPYNQVVRLYPEPKLFMLTIIDNIDNFEWYDETVTISAEFKKIDRPELIPINNYDDARKYIQKLEETDGTAEGLVLRDDNGLRLKVKSKTYLAYARLGGNGNLALDKNLIPLILANEQDEAIAIFPAIEPRVRKLQGIIEHLWMEFYCVWNSCRAISDQKEFAQYILKENPTPLSSILFNLKKNGTIFEASDNDLRDAFRESSDLILKVLGK